MHLPVTIPKSSAFRFALSLPFACAVFAPLAITAPASAQFTVCNNNAKALIMVAVAVEAGEPDSSNYRALVTTSGSTAVAAGECVAVIQGALFNVADINIFAWEPSNPTHTWSGDPRSPYWRCVPTAGKDGKAPHFMYQDHLGENPNPTCGPGQAKLNFLDLLVGFRQSYTENFKDPIEGQVPQQTNQPQAAPAPGQVASAAAAPSTPAPAALPKPAPVAAPKPPPAVLSTPGAPTGNAVLVVTSGLPAQPGAPNPLSAHTVVLLNQSFENVLTGAGLQAPSGVSLVKGYLAACANNQPACQAGINATNSSTDSGAKTDATGKAQLPGVPPGTYYFFCLGIYNNQLFKWDFPIQLKAGANSLTLSQQNAAPVN